MKEIDPAIVEICRRTKVSDYLRNLGVEVLRSGKRERCCCPLGTHSDSDPSFYIKTLPDGVQIFKCFGCGMAGNVITIMSLMEKVQKGIVIKRLSASTGIALAKFDITAIKMEPLPIEAAMAFCDEDEIMQNVARIAVQFLSANQTQDAVNKVSRLYEMLDMKAELGEAEEMRKYFEMLVETIREYRT